MLDLPRFAVMEYNKENDYWVCASMTNLMTYEQAKEEMNRLRGKGYTELYLVALGYIAGPSTDFDA